MSMTMDINQRLLDRAGCILVSHVQTLDCGYLQALDFSKLFRSWGLQLRAAEGILWFGWQGRRSLWSYDLSMVSE
jgi:hypothetical protein